MANSADPNSVPSHSRRSILSSTRTNQPRPDTTTNVRCIDVHALHKSATVFLHSFFAYLARKQAFRFFSIENEPPPRWHEDNKTHINFCRCPIRTFSSQENTLPSEVQAYKIYQIRDPRDILVSEYYSFGWIHPVNQNQLEKRREAIQNMSIDQYVLEQSESSNQPLEQRYQPLLDQDLDPEYTQVVTYEEMVTNFPKWAQKVVQPFGCRFPTWWGLKLGWRYRNEFKISSESMEHKRRITPGDHRNKLQPETISILNDRFAEILDRFGYQL